MAQNTVIESCRISYEAVYTQLLTTGCSDKEAAEKCAHRFLDGKPSTKGLTHSDRSAAFWACDFWQNVSAYCFEAEAVVLALSRSLPYGNPQPDILERILTTAPETLKQGICYSQLFLLPDSTPWDTIVNLSSSADDDFKLFINVCISLREERDRMKAPVEELQGQVAELTVLETLIYASLFTFQNVITGQCNDPEFDGELNEWEEDTWYALNQIVAWKLRTRPESDYQVTEQILVEALKQHIMPLIAPASLPTEAWSRHHELFSKLAVAQLEFNDFISTTVAPFCFDDDYSYRVEGDSVVLFYVEDSDENNWDKSRLKLEFLHRYWLNRALIETDVTGTLYKSFGKSENDHQNRFACIKARRIFLQLEEVYGLYGKLDFSDGTSIHLVNVVHSLELMTAFFNDAFIEPFKAFYKDSGHWGKALQQLVKDGLRDGVQNRFPLTWAEHEEKAQGTKSWTVSDQHPEGDIEEARAIYVFWCNDLQELAKDLKQNPNIPVPELHEKPILKLGQYGFQLPWLTAAQNNSTAVINNLRRLGSRHRSRGEETRRIERRLGEQLKTKGFSVVHGYQPEVNDSNDPGEVDLICFLAGHLFIFEVKSTYLRKTQQEAWLHRTNTLRKAGQQLKSKQEAVTSALKTDNALQDKLHINDYSEIIAVHAWLVDTSIDYDQEKIDGFLKVSLEALLIVLRNEQYLLRHSLIKSIISTEGTEPSGLSELFDQYEPGNNRKDDLFPQGFSAKRFAEIIEGGELWCVLDE